jgi:hypothetical protein
MPNRTIHVGDPHALGYALGSPRSENDISFVILPDLTDQDLEKIGVASLGHRRLLLRAITELKGGEIVAPKLTKENIAPVALQEIRNAASHGVFSDLVGSTAVSARVDPDPSGNHYDLLIPP